jgi:hypothetical protein
MPQSKHLRILTATSKTDTCKDQEIERRRPSGQSAHAAYRHWYYYYCIHWCTSEHMYGHTRNNPALTDGIPHDSTRNPFQLRVWTRRETFGSKPPNMPIVIWRRIVTTCNLRPGKAFRFPGFERWRTYFRGWNYRIWKGGFGGRTTDAKPHLSSLVECDKPGEAEINECWFPME